MSNVLVIGPSGSGKSFLVNKIGLTGSIKDKQVSSFDLDLVGYRSSPSNWKEWTIPPVILDSFHPASKSGRNYVLVGACSNHRDLISNASKLGIKRIALIPTLTDIIRFRTKRKDDVEKIEDSEADREIWLGIADDHKIVVTLTVAEALTTIYKML